MTLLYKTYNSALFTSDLGFNWTVEDYLIVVALLSILICLIVYIKRKVKNHKSHAPLIVAAIILILLILIDLGVGIFNFPWSGD